MASITASRSSAFAGRMISPAHPADAITAATSDDSIKMRITVRVYRIEARHRRGVGDPHSRNSNEFTEEADDILPCEVINCEADGKSHRHQLEVNERYVQSPGQHQPERHKNERKDRAVKTNRKAPAAGQREIQNVPGSPKVGNHRHRKHQNA